MKNYKWIIVGVILGLCFLIPFLLKSLNIQQIEQSISNSEFNTIANYYFSTVAQTMAAIMGFLITSIFAIYPLLSKDKPEYSIIRKFMFGEAILQSMIGIGLGSVVLSIISLLILYIFGNQNFVAFVIITIGILVAIFVVTTIALITYYLFKYIPLYSDAHEYLMFKKAFERNNLSENEIIDYVTTCFFIAISKTRYGRSPFKEIIDNQKHISAQSKNELYNKILTNIDNYLYKSSLDEDSKIKAKLFYYTYFCNSIELINASNELYKMKSNIIIKFLSHFSGNQNLEIRHTVKEIYDHIPSEIFNKASSNNFINYNLIDYEKQEIKEFINIWLEYIISLTESNHFVFLTCYSDYFTKLINVPKLFDLELNTREEDLIKIRKMHIKALFRFNVGILIYLKERYYYQNDIIDFKINPKILLDAFYNNVRNISKLKIDKNIFTNIYSNNSTRNETYIYCNTELIFLDPILIQNDLKDRIISQATLENIDFELIRIIFDIDKKEKDKDLTDKELLEKVIKIISEFRTNGNNIQDDMIKTWLDESMRKTIINKKYI